MNTEPSDPQYNPRLIKGKTSIARKGQLSGEKEPVGEVQGSGNPNRHGMPKLPVDQHITENWPVLDLGVHPKISKEKWKLEVQGEVNTPLQLNWKQFMALPQVTDISDFHCVTTWSLMDSEWVGVRLNTIAKIAGARAAGKFIFFHGYDGYTTNIKTEEMDNDVLLAHRWNRQDLPLEHGGPCRVIVPRKYAWKGSKWIKTIEFLSQEKLGFWEVRGYSNSAEPWHNDRYA